MTKIFDTMASLSSVSKSDIQEFFARVPELSPGEVGSVLGYLLGRLDSADAAAVISVLRQSRPQRQFKLARPTVNMVGTGGGPSTFNITTTAAFVVAAAGAVVVKTGSGACRSKSGFADVAARLGTLKVSMPWDELEAVAGDAGIVFIPPSHYPPLLGILEQNLTVPVYRNAASFFNKIGPLMAPVKVDHQFIGANSPTCLQMLAGACQILGDTPTTLMAAHDGMDEVSSTAKTTIIQLTAQNRLEQLIDPRSFGVQPPPPDALAGHEPAAAAACCEQILSGKGSTPQMEIVALNAGLVLSSLGMHADLSAGFRAALQILKQGEGLHVLRRLRERVWKCMKS